MPTVPSTWCSVSPAERAGWRQYALVTANYWAFTLTDGALRMLVLLHFHQLGYSPLQLASLFLLYELFGVVTNLFGGWLGARYGLNRSMNLGLGLQVLALLMLGLAAPAALSVAWVMAAQGLSGIAKDLNKMSAKASIKRLLPAGAEGRLYRWVAALTGSKNALKGVGFFLGGALLQWTGFRAALLGMAAALVLVWLGSLVLLRRDLGRASFKPKFRDLLSDSRSVNVLSAARLFLFGARDVWFVVALPVYLASAFGWSQGGIGAFLACWIIGYGLVQGVAPWLSGGRGRLPARNAVVGWAAVLSLVPAAIALWLPAGAAGEALLVAGLALFGALFAVNSSVHSALIVAVSRHDGVSLDVGFYYMSNALGRLLGTLLSGWLFQRAGLDACLYASSLLLAAAALIALALPPASQGAEPGAAR